jgi:hypothetical protein
MCTIVDHFAATLEEEDLDAHLGGRKKEPYKFIICKPSSTLKVLLEENPI